jgi:hypothetical protein
MYKLFSSAIPGLALLGFATQLPFPPEGIPFHKMSTISDFELKTGEDRFSPKDLIELHRPGAGKANAAGDLVLASVSKYSFEVDKYEFPQFLAFGLC